MNDFAKKLVTVALISIGLAFIFAVPTRWLWNGLMPSIFGLKAITYWQALGLNLFSAIVFKDPVKINFKQ